MKYIDKWQLSPHHILVCELRAKNESALINWNRTLEYYISQVWKCFRICTWQKPEKDDECTCQHLKKLYTHTFSTDNNNTETWLNIVLNVRSYVA